MSRTTPTRVEEVLLYASCETCGAAPREWCTVGQYHDRSPHRSTRAAQYLHARRGGVLLEVYWLGQDEGEREGKLIAKQKVRRVVTELDTRADAFKGTPVEDAYLNAGSMVCAALDMPRKVL